MSQTCPDGSRTQAVASSAEGSGLTVRRVDKEGVQEGAATQPPRLFSPLQIELPTNRLFSRRSTNRLFSNLSKNAHSFYGRACR